MTELQNFRAALHDQQFLFAQTLQFIAAQYDYSPSAFSNGDLHNPAGQNEGACRLIGLALLENLTLQETLLAFGEHYRNVLAYPDGTDHGNIRALIDSGLSGVRFAAPPLKRRT
jgi:hypothetical protein